MAVCMQNMGNTHEAIRHYHLALNLTRNLKQNFDKVISRIYINYAVCSTSLGQYNKAIDMLKKAIDALVKIYSSNKKHPDIAYTYNNLGMCYINKGNYDEGLKCYQKALDILLHFLEKEHSNTAIIYNNIGAAFKQKGHIEKALMYFEKCLHIRFDIPQTSQEQIAQSYINLGTCYFSKKQFDKALSYFEKAGQILTESHYAGSNNLAKVYNNIGLSFEGKKEFNKALIYFYKGLQIRIEALGKKHPDIAFSYHYIGKIFKANLQFDKALTYFKNSADLILKTLGPHHLFLSRDYYEMANVLVQKNDYDAAFSYIRKAYYVLLKSYPNNDIHTLPDLQNYQADEFIMLTVFTKANILYRYYQHRQKQFPKDLNVAIQHYDLAIRLIEEIQHGYKKEGSKLIIANYIQDISEKAIDVLYEKYKLSSSKPKKEACLQQIFNYIEKNKALTLYAGIKDALAKKVANIPEKLLQQEKNLRIELNYLDKKIQQQKAQQHLNQNGSNNNNNDNTETLKTLQNLFFEYHQSYEQLIEKLENEYAGYYQLKYSVSTANIPQIEQHLISKKQAEALISYFVGENNIYIFLILPNTPTKNQNNPLRFFKIDKPDNFNQLINDYLNSINDIYRKLYIQKAHQLYQVLFEPVNPILKADNITHLTIIPNAQLHYIPFEALLQKKHKEDVDYKDLSYLINQYTVSYHYSATLWAFKQQNKGGKIKQDTSFFGIAPGYTSSSGSSFDEQRNLFEEKEKTAQVTLPASAGYNDLFYTEKEVQDIQLLFEKSSLKSKVLLKESATVEHFQQYVSGYTFVHIAAHGIYDIKQPELSGIVLSKNKNTNSEKGAALPFFHDAAHIFTLSDAYNLDLKADLVVMSSCESGLGNLSRGEGMITLNRGLLYSGAHNILFTLFKVYDKASYTLTQQFYEDVLKNKTSYSTALQNAKRHLIKQADTSPKHWAGFVLIGQ